MYTVILLVLLQIISTRSDERKSGWALVGNPLLHVHPCMDNEDITIAFEPNLPPGQENQYLVFLKENFPFQSRIKIKFDSDARVNLIGDVSSFARIKTLGDYFQVHFFKEGSHLNFNVSGPSYGTVPYITSLVVNNVEYCKEPKTGYLDEFIIGTQDTAEIQLTVPDQDCGRRKIQHTELITNGLATKPGDWPWHAAIYRLEKSNIKYICGGTLLSKTYVVTAAHCVTIRGKPVLPEILSVILGKYNLIGGDVAIQEKEVHSITVHDEFAYNKHLDNDIALIKLRTEADFDDYVQPVCLWYAEANKKLPATQILGTVAGWGFDHTDTLSSQLKQATMPIVSEAKCIKSNPLFFGNVLNDRKFCAGWNNGTSACNGDSGGGFQVFIPDNPEDQSSKSTGAWYIRGIVSISASRKDIALCDPNQYGVFTDVAKFSNWIKSIVK